MLSVVVPVYNEDKNIIKLFEEIKNHLTNLPGNSSHIETLIVYDFEGDTTIPVVTQNMDKFSNLNIKLVKNDYGPGVVNAIKKGFNTAKGDYILVLMADLSDDLSIVGKMVEKMDNGYDIVCGSRYIKGGKQIGGAKFKKFLSGLAGRSLRILSKIPTNDVTNNFKIYRKSVIDAINIESNGGFEIAMEITVKAFKKGYKITEIASTWTDREYGKSNFKMLKWLPHYLRWYFYCIFNKGPLKKY